MIWIDLIYNLALLIALSVVSGFVDMRWKRETRLGVLFQGLVFGGAAAIGMLRPFVYGPGLIFDGRSVMISLGGLFFGPWTAAVTCLITIPLRVVQGGPGTGMGVLVILASAAIGMGFHRSRRGKTGEISAATLLEFGLLVHMAMLAMTVALPAEMRLPVLKRIAWPVMLIYPLATVLIGKILSDRAAGNRLVESLREERERLAGILAGTHVGTWEWSVQTGELIVNDRWAEIIGCTLEEIFPATIETWRKHIHPDDLQTAEELLEKHFQGEVDYFEFESRMKHKDGSWVWVLNRGKVTAWTKEGKPLMMMGTHQDITARKKEEEERVQLEADLLQAQKMESVGRLAGGVAHDFNNILTVILGHVDMALAQTDSAQPIHRDLTEIRKAAKRSADLTRQLLAFARKQPVAPKILDLNETVAGMLQMLKRLIGEDIALNWRPKALLWSVKMDPSQIDQILINLCANARDSISGVGRIVIETENVTLAAADCMGHAGVSSGEFVRLAVRDDGAGMDRETLDHIFEPFFTTKEIGQGTGLGLATIYGIVKQNNGFIQVDSEPGQGTTFHLYLPRHAGPAGLIPKEDPGTPVAPGHETILLVEDEKPILDMAKRLIESHGYTVLAASTPGEALRLAQKHVGAIQLLITDIVMPEMNGRDLARNLLGRYPQLKLLFMSGYTANIIAHNGVMDESVCFIQKPFTHQALALQIRKVLDS